MRNLFVLLPLMIFSCSQYSERTAIRTVTFTIDTVMVDPGEDFIYMQDGASTVSPDGAFFYHFNRPIHTLEKISLEQLRPVDKHPFEKEGPNGTGDMVYSIHMLDNNHIYINADQSSGIFSLDGARTEHFNLDYDFEGDLITANEGVDYHIMVPDQLGVVFALVFNSEENTINLRKMDFKEKRITKYEIDPEGKIPQYSFTVPSMGKNPIGNPGVYLSVQGGSLLITTNLSNEIALYDPVGDSLVFKRSDHQLVSNEKTGKYPVEYASIRDLMVTYQKVGEEVNFLPPIWDETNERYYRFAHLIEFEKEKAPDAMLPGISRLNLFIFIYNKNFDLLAESPVPLSLRSVYGLLDSFVRDGSIWLGEGFDEELGFVRMKVDMDED
jgi:hypothetical protein